MTNQERGANVRRNLRRWWKQLLVMMIAWVILALGVIIAAVTYAHANHFSESRIQMLAEGCGSVLMLILFIAWMTVLVLADRKKSE
jgi:lysylphosphatidylglycerol synthetase-like protein (DUF2156 family)